MITGILALVTQAIILYFLKKDSSDLWKEKNVLDMKIYELSKRVPSDPRLCSTHGHEMDAVYDESAGTELSEDKISALSDAARMNSESIESLIELATKNKSRVYVKHVCRYCGLVVERDGRKQATAPESLDE